ncbi:NHL repeat-containing protein [Streptomyces sp. 1331.2]|uniref:NHL repeat-containing protein n=1 Tax=Streptomyces sp. 1331.2 TaxID=1938835 RepID=UPI000BD04202|nr:NHL repeat-containing protein [Streptomyces sp. 1331.2]SOB78662.1 Sugar lactone lactonase YvrE [Streptomyces sp. 1331.2]
MRRRHGVLLTAALLAQLAAGPSHAAAPAGWDPAGQCGVVRSGDTPLGGAEVTLYQAGDGRGAAPRVLARTRSAEDGRFTLDYRRPRDPNAVLYVLADLGPAPTRAPQAPAAPERALQDRPPRHGPDGPVTLAAVLSGAGAPPELVVNERTTVAVAYALARFTGPAGVSGTRPGLQNAAAIAHNLADTGTGDIAAPLATPPNGALTSTMAEFNTLANLLASCVTGDACDQLFDLARRPGHERPRDTLRAAVDIAHDPGHNAAALFALADTTPRYRPALPAAPDAWTVALRYDGNGRELDGPGNIAFDADGNAWVSNNYGYDADPAHPVCGGRTVLKFTPTGHDAPGAPYTGGGLYGAGFGITVDARGSAWVANFGFQGRGCPIDPTDLERSLSQFAPDGTPLSPPEGWRGHGIAQPQGMAADRSGTVWAADCGGGGVTRIPDGDATRAREVPTPALSKPFGAAVDPDGRLWVSGNGNDSVQVLGPDGTAERTVTGGGLRRPLALATDSKGYAWVSNSGILPVPCADTTADDLTTAALAGDTGPRPGASVTLIAPDGTPAPAPFTDGGLFLPWGIAVDGDDTVWVANFGGHRVARLCGTDLTACPPGHRTGQPLSPPGTGYSSDALERNTGLQIDPSGNVWLANNWRTVPVQTNPGGHELVVLIGAAAPVRTPALGGPAQP